MTSQTCIVWFRQDLRLEDNPAFEAALMKSVSIIPVYIYAPEEEEEWPLGGASKWWLHYSLKSLSQELLDRGLKLILRKGNTLSILDEMIQSTKATSVVWNRRYEPTSIKRDSKIKEYLNEADIKVQSFNGSLLFEPWTITNKQGKPFQVFTPFWKACMAMPEPLLEKIKPTTKQLNKVDLETLSLEDLELLPKIHWDTGLAATWKPGAPEAKKMLNAFIKNAISQYKQQRDRPDLPGVSLLSPYLHFGEISPRMIWSTIKQHCDIHQEGVECYLRQLGWREFAHHLLYHFPKTPNEPLRSDFKHFPWQEETAQLKAWQKGQTGYPIVDAAMRQLWAIGWMHNRLRMIVGSFLVKDLLIPWQQGAAWFWDTLVDADLANNTLGWQWVGGCGADAAPYFRIFNPITQGEKFDPEAVFVRQWVPEIAALPNEWIHKPWEAPENLLRACNITLGKTYPKPIINHAQARERALEAFQKIKNIET